MNKDSEQITRDATLLTAPDQPLDGGQIMKCLEEALGKDNCRTITVGPRRNVLEYKAGKKTYHLLPKACTYLGNPHPINKKRIQLPTWYNEYAEKTKESDPSIDVRYIGVYHYGDNDHGDNIIFVDFNKDTYLAKKGHNSSAHVYTNDLYQGMTYGVFTKKDKFGNTITTIRKDKLADYLSGRATQKHTLFDLFREFNSEFPFGQWLEAVECIKEMHENGWHHWRQAEWAGWYLEYRFNKFITDNKLNGRMRYVGSSLKKDGDLDFDVKFEKEKFFGDLKASDIKKKETPGNDQENLKECLQKHGRFWYIIFEHDTEKDSKETNYEAARGRIQYIRSVDQFCDKKEDSYKTRMKKKVRFAKMSIIELNKTNYSEALTDFKQGHQPDGSKRKPKFNINKKVLDNDNFVVFRYSCNKQ